MSSHNNNERQLLESLQEAYRRAWHKYQLEVTLQQTAESDFNSYAGSAAAEYREARNALASFLLAENPQDDESAYAVRLANVVARCHRSLARSQAA